MAANAITLFRLLITFVVIAIFNQQEYIDIVCIVTIVIIFYLDSVDGIVARKRNETTAFGAVFDIAVDRIVEIVFWIYFSVIVEVIPIWMPMVVITRGILTDSVRSMAMQDDKTPFEMMTIPWTRALTSSRFSRGFYGGIKLITFVLLPILSFLTQYYPTTPIIPTFSLVTIIFAYSTVVVCLIRGFPVFVDGWKYINANQ
ncbi:CDP-alcohol phosphatidyltransferase family protein [Candidatus Poribacteria bacterium]|nr:CDP-alcohol phosphatidyltransferase family protein [Candidatus Poribacteria bacterium]